MTLLLKQQALLSCSDESSAQITSCWYFAQKANLREDVYCFLLNKVEHCTVKTNEQVAMFLNKPC